MATQISLKDIIAVKDASRVIRAYAFLDASLQVSQNSTNPTQDALDCFLPFLVAGTEAQKGNQLDYGALQKYLKTNFGFEIPIYALEQMSKFLAERGHLTHNATLGGYICAGDAGAFLSEKKQVLASYEALDESINEFAATQELPTPPVSSTWMDALIAFLRDAPEELRTPKNVKGVLIIQGVKVERYVIGKFVEYAHQNRPDIFSGIVSVFKGALIEDFISGGIQASAAQQVRDLTIYYDTSLLLRLLGCSGKLLGDATAELHRYLSDLGCATKFLRVSEGEVANIIQTLIGKRDAGDVIFGETGDAISRGEFSVGELRSLNGRFVERLASNGVFESKETINTIHNVARFQIDERGFEAFLKEEAVKRGAIYKFENLANDAQALSAVMAFRRGHKSRDVLSSKFLFVTSNKLLAGASRKFLTKERAITWVDCPPILHVGQLTTIIWLLKNKQLTDKLVTRDLLANCAAAYRPDPDWMDKFMQAIDAAKILAAQNGEGMLDDSVKLQAARRIAQDLSFGRTALLDKVSLAEVLAKADTEKSTLMASEKAAGRDEGIRWAEERQEAVFVERADRWAAAIVRFFEVVVIALAVLSAVLVVPGAEAYSPSWASISAAVIAVPIGTIATLDLFDIKLIAPGINAVRTWLRRQILKLLSGKK